MSISHETVTNYRIYYLTQAQYDALEASGSITVDGQTIQYDQTAEYRTPDNTPEELSTKYVKPSTGIPKTDLTQEVQTSLGKADTALQAVPDTYRTAAAQDVIDELLGSTIPDTTQTVTFDANGKPQSIVHSNGSTAVRTDVFIWGQSSVTETRTLADGRYIVLATNLATLVTTITDIQGAG